MAGEEPDTVREEFAGAVNMTAGELEAWLETDESRSVGQDADGSGESTGHASGRRIVELLGLPLPQACALAQKLLGKAAQVEVPAPSHRLADPASEAELGDALLTLVQLGRDRGWDAERALRERLRTLRADVRAAEGGPR